jgi:hypothetical protein
VQIDWLLANAIGGVRVQVADGDVAAAHELLAAQDAESDSR